jgi:hypothetical protein
VLTVIVIIMGRSISSVNISCDNNGGDLYVVLTVIVIITGISVCNVNIHSDNNGEIYMQC